MFSILLPFALSASIIVGPERPISPPVLEAATGNQKQPAIASDGKGWLAAWLNGQFDYSVPNVLATRIDSDENVLDSAPLVVSNSSDGAVAVAAGTEGFLVVWSQDGVRARLVDGDGNLSPVVTIAARQRPVYSFSVAAAFTSGHFLVAWSDNESIASTQWAALLDARGNIVTSDVRLWNQLAAGIGSVAAGATDFLVSGAFLDTNSSAHPYPREAFAIRVSLNGAVSPPVILSDPADATAYVHAAWSGSEYFVAWSTNRIDTGDSRGARIAPDNSFTRTPSFYAG